MYMCMYVCIHIFTHIDIHISHPYWVHGMAQRVDSSFQFLLLSLNYPVFTIPIRVSCICDATRQMKLHLCAGIKDKTLNNCVCVLSCFILVYSSECNACFS